MTCHFPDSHCKAHSIAKEAQKIHAHDCHDHQAKSTFIKVVEKMCLIALVAFSAMVSIELFVPAFAFGVAVGIGNYFFYRNQHTGKDSDGCSNGFLEQLAGLKLPALLSIGVNMATLVCHIDHHPGVFVRVAAFMGGMTLGDMLAHGCTLAHKKLTSVPAQLSYS